MNQPAPEVEIATAGKVGTILVTAALALTGCASLTGKVSPASDCTDPTDHTITINFVGGCPDTIVVDPASQCSVTETDCVRVSKNKSPKIRWKSNPTNNKFAVFFDPLVGPQYISNPAGCLKRSINPDAPPATYKYTVAKMTQNNKIDTSCDVVDPRVVVQP